MRLQTLQTKIRAISAAIHACGMDLQQACESMDTDRDGWLSVREVSAFMAELQLDVDTHDVADMMMAIDIDGDGDINFQVRTLESVFLFCIYSFS